MRNWRRLTLALALLALGAGTAAAQDFTLTIFHNNDGESSLLPDDAGFGGAANFITKLNALRTADTSDGSLMVSSGDNFLAGPAFNASLEHGVPFYDTIVMDLVGYDAVCLGNHDFDFTPDVLADFMAGYTSLPQYLSANLDFSGEPGLQAYVDSGDLAGSTVVMVAGQPIGIVGATTEALPYISSPRNVIVNAVAPAVQAEVDALTGMGVDKIILISHLQSVLEDLDLATMLTGVDVMIAGGGDELLANAGDLLIPGQEGDVYGPYPMTATGGDLASIPVVTTSGQYQYIGKLQVTFDAAGNVTAASGGPVRVADETWPDGVVADPTAQAMAIDPVIDYVDALDATTIATSAVTLDGVRAHVRSMETNEGDLCADALLWNARRLAADFGVAEADVALQNGGGIRNDAEIPPGDITLLDTWNILPFANFLSVVEGVGRDQFKEILENCVSRVEFADGRFGQIGGAMFRWDPAGTPQELDADGNVVVPGSRIVEASLMTTPPTVLVENGVVVAGPALTVATIDFLAGGGDQYPFRGLPFVRLGLTYQQTLQTYLIDGLAGVITAADYPEGGEGRIVMEDVVPVALSLFELESAGGLVNLRWQSAAAESQFRLLRGVDGGEVELSYSELGAGSFAAEDRPGVEGRVSYQLYGRQPGEEWQFLRSENVDVHLTIARTAIVGAFPNPFNPKTNVRFSLAEAGPVRLSVFDAQGRQVATLVDGRLGAGDHEVSWNAGEAGSGIYLVRIQSASGVDSRKLVLTK
ncbi:5'-nucleotidase C-terminal domain-containing protein [bacterium]|nr:5'-nucleotidase C-terminal domain-containing protein [bacterium]